MKFISIIPPQLLFIIAFCVSSVTISHAQLSPGELTKAHAELEGISNCTECHTLGKKISSDKCLECHETIKSLVDDNNGYHASPEVRRQDCFACHSEHHGRNFEMIRFDTDEFNHDQTGYMLYGAHDRLECAECHKQEFIVNKSMSKRENTFLGLETACLNCHDDFHQNTMSSDCISCHNTESFRPAELFSHDFTDFPLLGQHKEVECIECHPMIVQNGREIQEFAGIEFTNCSACHDDAHQSRFGNDCKQCHTEESFHVIAGRTNFDHSTTDFPLNGQHKLIDCASCHDAGGNSESIFKDFVHLDAINCTNCHDDVHENKFGTDCKSCHNEVSFQDASEIEDFDHDLTAFSLEGKHRTVECRQCHETNMTDPLAHNQCMSCHDDYHEGQFVSTGNITQDCAECHTVEGFDISSFSIEQHNEGNFSLTGAHLATPCFSCHLKDEKWQFREIGFTCVECHEDIHQGQIEDKYYPDQDCKECHSEVAWSQVEFDHTLTEFDLEGAHQLATCTSCHLDESNTNISEQSFAGLSSTCSECHEDQHRGQFEVDGATICSRCHNSELWKPSQFDHDSTEFVLEGAHLEVACNECHKEVSLNNETYIQYRIINFECASCHN